MSISSDWMGALGMLSKGLFSCVLSWSLAFSVGSSTSWECARASGLTGTTSNGSCRWESLSRIYKYSLPGVQRECFDYVSEADESALAYYYYSKMWSRPLPYLHIKELHEVRSRSRIPINKYLKCLPIYYLSQTLSLTWTRESKARLALLFIQPMLWSLRKRREQPFRRNLWHLHGCPAGTVWQWIQSCLGCPPGSSISNIRIPYLLLFVLLLVISLVAGLEPWADSGDIESARKKVHSSPLKCSLSS